MIVKRTKCDNPFCKETGVPENQDPYVAPYGWLVISASVIGCGPSDVEIEVCGMDCIAQALTAKARYEDND